MNEHTSGIENIDAAMRQERDRRLKEYREGLLLGFVWAAILAAILCFLLSCGCTAAHAASFDMDPASKAAINVAHAPQVPEPSAGAYLLLSGAVWVLVVAGVYRARHGKGGV